MNVPRATWPVLNNNSVSDPEIPWNTEGDIPYISGNSEFRALKKTSTYRGVSPPLATFQGNSFIYLFL
jgi:hypothetical protein